MSDVGQINKCYKDSLFRRLFGTEENKHHLLSLYNALNHSNYTDLTQIEFYTLEDVIYINYKNDVSFLINGELNMYEHQSTFNPNMPLRGFIYAASEYERFISKNRLSLYSPKKLQIPIPKYIVFYNGIKDMPERSTLKLSDMFFKKRESDADGFEWTATVININGKYNKELKDACEALKDYSSFIDNVYTNLSSGLNSQSAVEMAVNNAIAQKNSLSGILATCKSEVVTMFLSEFDKEAYDKAVKEYAMEQGMAEGLEKGIAEGLEKGIAEGLEKGIAEGLEKGIDIGEAKKEKEMFLNFLDYGMSVEKIAEICKTTTEHVEEVVNS